ncbi:MAG: MFS transporter [Pseudonocardiales bacterium]
MTPSGTLRADPGFRRYLAARVVSMAGTLITAVVLPVLVYRLTGSAAWTAAVVVVQALPQLLAPFVGSMVARCRHPGRLLCTADLVGGALLISIPLAWWNDGLSGWHVLAVAGAVQAVFVLLALAHPRALQTLVGPELTAAGRTAVRSATGLVELMVPPLAGLAVTIVAPAGLLTLDAVSFLASALLVRAALGKAALGKLALGKLALGSRSGAGAPPPPPPLAPPLAPARGRVRAGLRFVRGNAAARKVALAGTLHAAAVAAFLAMLLPWADRQLDVPPSGDARLALLLSCWGLGAIGGCALFLALVRWLGPVRLVRNGLVVSLACGIGVATATHWLPAVLIGLVWGAVYPVTAKAAVGSLAKLARPAVPLLWRGIGPATGAALAGVLAVWSTPRAGLLLGVVLLTVAVFAAWWGTAPGPPGSVPHQADARAHGARTPGLGARSEGQSRAPGILADRAAHGDVARDRPGPRTSIP